MESKTFGDGMKNGRVGINNRGDIIAVPPEGGKFLAFPIEKCLNFHHTNAAQLLDHIIIRITVSSKGLISFANLSIYIFAAGSFRVLS